MESKMTVRQLTQEEVDALWVQHAIVLNDCFDFRRSTKVFGIERKGQIFAYIMPELGRRVSIGALIGEKRQFLDEQFTELMEKGA